MSYQLPGLSTQPITTDQLRSIVLRHLTKPMTVPKLTRKLQLAGFDVRTSAVRRELDRHVTLKRAFCYLAVVKERGRAGGPRFPFLRRHYGRLSVHVKDVFEGIVQ